MSTPPPDPDRFPGEDRVRRAFGRLRSDAARAVDARQGLATIEKRGRPWVRAAVPALSAATLLVVVIGLVALLRDGGPEVTGPATSLTTTTSGLTTTTIDPATTTTEPPVTTTEPPVTTTTESPTTTTVPPQVTPGYRVTGVESGDVLNVRAGPGVGHPVVGTLASDAVGVVTTGLATPGVPGAAWWEVELSDGTLGWVNAGFLALPDEWTAPFLEYPCFGGTSESPPTGPSNADHIFALDYLRSDDCRRLVVVLGSDGGWHLDPPWPQTPASAVLGDGGETVVGPTPGTVGNSSTIVVTGFLGVVERVRPTATEADFGGPMAFVVRRGAGPLDVKVHFAGNVLAEAFYLSDPARIVVDIADAPTTPGHDYRPLVGPGVVVTAPTGATGDGAPIPLPISVAGYARPFEATGYAELRTVGVAPGSGELVEARFSCDFAGGVGSSCAFMTTDYLEAWGAFGFEIDELAPGDYELFVGELSAETGEPIGVYHRFTIAP